jgi:hypothetical protein
MESSILLVAILRGNQCAVRSPSSSFMLLMLTFARMISMPSKKMHERTGEYEEEWCVRKDYLPLEDICQSEN